MDDLKHAELLGANDSKMTLHGSSSSTKVQLDSTVMQHTVESFAALDLDAPQLPDRVYLQLENLRSSFDGHILDVYIGLPGSDEAESHAEYLVGSIPFFGVSQASDPDEPHGGVGVSPIFDITDLIDELHLGGNLSALSNIDVHVRSRHQALEEDDNVTIDRVSVYRAAGN